MTSMIDVESKLDRNQARKLLSEILSQRGTSVISFSKHCRAEMANDSLTSVDVFNVLKAGNIYTEAEFVNGTYRYRVETNNLLVVIAFCRPNIIRCITAWRK